MDQLSNYEIMTLIRMSEEAVTTQFQVWLTITFSTIVAVFAGRSVLTKSIKWLVTMLYSLASLATVASGLYLAEGNAQLTHLLSTRDVAIAAPTFASAVYFALFFAGYATTLYFIHMSSKYDDAKTSTTSL